MQFFTSALLSAFVCFSAPSSRPMTIQPICVAAGQGVWDGHAFWYTDDEKLLESYDLKKAFSAFSSMSTMQSKPKPFAYYIALPPMPSGLSLPEVLTPENADAILNMLIRNEPNAKTKKELEKLASEEKNHVPLTASPLTAMTLAFFSYKPVPLNENQSQPLQLHTIRTDCLPGGKAPYEHPFCSFWLASVEDLLVLMARGSAAMKTQTCHMTVTQTGEYVMHDHVIDCNRKTRLENKKRKLEEDVELFETQLVNSKEDIADVNQALSNLVNDEQAVAAMSSQRPSSNRQGTAASQLAWMLGSIFKGLWVELQ